MSDDGTYEESVTIPDLRADQLMLKSFTTESGDDVDNIVETGEDVEDIPARLELSWDVGADEPHYIQELLTLTLRLDTPGGPQQWFVTLDDEQVEKLREALEDYLGEVDE